MIVYQRYCCVCMSIFVFHTYTISQYVYVFNTYIHIICAIHPTPKGVGFSHISCKSLECSIDELFVSDDPQIQRLLAYAHKFNDLNYKDKSDTE